jgi:hypothetical protein
MLWAGRGMRANKYETSLPRIHADLRGYFFEEVWNAVWWFSNGRDASTWR